ncbi:MAG: YerC/YecD family TrpR-related protein [Patescibacteria group bacterium]|nr:YerC/YecD family TrpR-related protein [Patescibacteria group bacterium]
MARYNRLQKIEKLKLLAALCEAISSTKNSQEAAKLLTDLLSPSEIEIVAKRLEIAKLLIKGNSYDEIKDRVHAGYSTIARVNTWLNLAGDGFKMAVERMKEDKKEPSIEEKFNPFSWYNIGRRYPTRIWPLMAIEQFLEIASKREKSKLLSILQSMESKKQIFTKEANKAFYEQFPNKIKGKMGLTDNSNLDKEQSKKSKEKEENGDFL